MPRRSPVALPPPAPPLPQRRPRGRGDPARRRSRLRSAPLHPGRGPFHRRPRRAVPCRTAAPPAPSPPASPPPPVAALSPRSPRTPPPPPGLAEPRRWHLAPLPPRDSEPHRRSRARVRHVRAGQLASRPRAPGTAVHAGPRAAPRPPGHSRAWHWGAVQVRNPAHLNVPLYCTVLQRCRVFLGRITPPFVPSLPCRPPPPLAFPSSHPQPSPHAFPHHTHSSPMTPWLSGHTLPSLPRARRVPHAQPTGEQPPALGQQ